MRVSAWRFEKGHRKTGGPVGRPNLVGSQSAMKCDAMTGRENNNRSLIASEQANNRLSRSPLPAPPHKLIERVKRPSRLHRRFRLHRLDGIVNREQWASFGATALAICLLAQVLGERRRP